MKHVFAVYSAGRKGSFLFGLFTTFESALRYAERECEPGARQVVVEAGKHIAIERKGGTLHVAQMEVQE